MVNVNKIIKPEDLQKAQALKKDSPDKARTKPTARKRTGGNPNPLGRKRSPRKNISKKTIIEFDDSDDEDIDWGGRHNKSDTEDDDGGEDRKPKESTAKQERPKRQSKAISHSYEEKEDEEEIEVVPPLSMPLEQTTTWSDDSEDDYVPDFEKDEETDDDVNDSKDIKLPIKIKQEAMDDATHIQIEPLDEFEYSPIDSDVKKVKSEVEDMNIFSEKDKILECLLNESDYSRLDKGSKKSTGTLQPHKKRKHHQKSYGDDSDDDYTLEETEVVLVKNEDSDDDEHFPIEDMLEVKAEVS